MIQWQVIEAQVDMPAVGAITLYVSLLTFTLRVHPDRLDYVDQVLVCFIWGLYLENISFSAIILAMLFYGIGECIRVILFVLYYSSFLTGSLC